MHNVLLLFLFFAISSPADEIQSKALITTQSVIVVGNFETAHQDKQSFAQKVNFINLEVPGNALRLKRKLSETLIGQPINATTIAAGKKTIQDFYRDQGRPLTSVHVPEQKITHGTLRFLVIESHIEAIKYQGNHWFSTKQLQKNIQQKEATPFNANQVQKDLIWLNRSPFRETALILAPGTRENTTELTFVSKDQRPYRLFIGTDNTGYRTTGRERLFTGVHLGNLFSLDHRLSYRYTVSTEFGRFFAHTGQYVIPLPWRHLLEFYGGYSGIHALILGSQMASRGKAWQASMRYTIPLTPKGAYNHEIKWGIDYKSTDVNLVLGAVPILGDRTVITQFMLGYYGSIEMSIADLSFEAEGFVAPGDIFHGQSAADFSSLRPKAKSRYGYLRGSCTPLFHLPASLQLVLKSAAQVTNRNLLSSEQFGLGGLYTVRGYDERILNTDNGLLLSAELRSPPLKPLTRHAKQPPLELLQFLAFIDYGLGVNHNTLAYERDYRYLLGVGLGVCYYYSYHVSARVNLGYPLHRHIAPNIKQPPGVRLNFSAIISF